MNEYNTMSLDMTVKKVVKYRIEGKSELRKDVEDAADNVKIGAKAVFNKLDNSYGKLKAASYKEKRKHGLN
jgi:hypothetical protein